MSNGLCLTLLHRRKFSRVSRALQSDQGSPVAIAQAQADALRILEERTATPAARVTFEGLSTPLHRRGRLGGDRAELIAIDT